MNKTQVTIPWKWTNSRQLEFVEACGLSYPVDTKYTGPTSPKARIILYGGSAGSGKTSCLVLVSFIAGVSFPGCSIGYFRRTYPELEGPGGAIMESHKIYGKFTKYHKGIHRHTFPNGSILQFCHAKTEEDIYSYNSQQFDILLIDESTQFTEFQLRYILSRNRATVRNIIPFCAMATNPGGVSHGYHKKHFVDVCTPGIPTDVEIEEGVLERHLFIPARLSDNKVLEERDPGYRATLERMPEDQRRALLDGDWGVFSGQYFKEFSVDKHVVEPFEIPADWQRHGSIDWGFKAPCAVHWHAIDPASGRVFTYRELYITEHRAAEVAELMKELSGGEELAYVKASPDMWHERGLGSKALPGEVIAEEFLKVGINVERADNRRILGWTRMREYLSDMADGKPGWQIFSNCSNLIRTLPEVIHDKRKVEDIAPECEDHAVESCVTGDTLIDTTYGQKPIKEMVGQTWQVYCYDEANKQATTAKAYDVRMTKAKAKVYSLELEDGRKVKVTGTHPVLTTKGWVNVSDLSIGDDIVDIQEEVGQSAS